MERREVVIVRTSTANLASVVGAFERLGAVPVVTTDVAVIRAAEYLVLPGVGTLGAAMADLRERGLERALTDRLADGRPVLAICLGLQVLLEASEESPGVRALGTAPGTATRFTGIRTPHMGWSRVTDTASLGVGIGYAYFAHSYRLTQPPPGWSISWADHGGRFVAAMTRGAILACQFHPELSGPWGAALLRAWVGQTDSPVSSDQGVKAATEEC